MNNQNFNVQGVMPGFGEVEQKFYEGIDSMIKLRVESKLFADINVTLSDISKKNSMYKALGRHAMRIKNRALRRLDRSYKQGLREIDKKIPVYVELPKYEKKGDGGYTKSDDKDTIHVNDILNPNDNQAYIGLDEKTEILQNKPPAGLIEE